MLEWKYHQKNLKKIAFLGQDPAIRKIIANNGCLQVNNFKYLSCEIFYENEKDIQQKISKICSNTAKSKQHFSTNFGPEIFKNKRISGSPHSFVWKRNLHAYRKE
jgi:hypothetical protein